MTAYDSLIGSALEQLGKKLKDDRVPGGQTQELVDLVRAANFPALLALIGSAGKGDGELGQHLLREAARVAAERPEITGLRVSADDVERILTAVFVHGASPDSVLDDAALRNRLFQAGMQELAKRVGAPITPDEVAEAVRLLSTGEFFGDVQATTAAVVFAVRGMPIALVDDAQAFPHRAALLLPAVVADLVGTPFVPFVVLQDLLADGKLDHPPKVLTHTLRALFRFGTVRSTARTIADVIRPENKTVRLAVVIYARSHGIPLQEKDLDAVRTHLLATDEPDLGPLLVEAVSRYVDRQQAGRLTELLRGVVATQHG
jgi:hypothetical protein